MARRGGSGEGRLLCRVGCLLLFALLGGSTRLPAQLGELAGQCADLSSNVRTTCWLTAQAIELTQPRVGLAASGGNPVPGTANTLGLRLGSTPRLSIAGRATVVGLTLPPIQHRDGGQVTLTIPTFAADGAVGVFQGFSPRPAVAGVGSVDILGSIGFVPIFDRAGFQRRNPFSWAIGTRIGVIRESFTLPAVSFSALYRRVGEVAFGDVDLEDTDAFFRLRSSNLSLRGAVSRRFFAIGVAGGLGYDRYSSDPTWGVRSEDANEPIATFSVDDFTNSRYTLFANLSYTTLIWHLVAEAGWQSGASHVPELSASELRMDPSDGRFFGSLAIRMSM